MDILHVLLQHIMVGLVFATSGEGLECRTDSRTSIICRVSHRFWGSTASRPRAEASAAASWQKLFCGVVPAHVNAIFRQRKARRGCALTFVHAQTPFLHVLCRITWVFLPIVPQEFQSSQASVLSASWLRNLSKISLRQLRNPWLFGFSGEPLQETERPLAPTPSKYWSQWDVHREIMSIPSYRPITLTWSCWLATSEGFLITQPPFVPADIHK